MNSELVLLVNLFVAGLALIPVTAHVYAIRITRIQRGLYLATLSVWVLACTSTVVMVVIK